MGRTKGSKNKDSAFRPATSELSVDERLELVANLIIDQIQEDQKNEQRLLKQIKREEEKAKCLTTSTPGMA
ncbi:MAG TPA: hypothetical protein VF733_03770 [Candidatus Saccharimonadales bacterium]